MIIAVNMVRHGNDELDEQPGFLYECFTRIAAAHPQHQFIYILDRIAGTIDAKNITPVIVAPLSSRILLWRYWYNYKLPAIAKKHKADVLVSSGAGSLRTKIPQCLLIPALDIFHIPQFIPKSRLRFLKKFTPRSIQKAKRIVTLSESAKQEIAKRYSTNSEWIDVVYSGADTIFQPLDGKEKEAIKEKYTQGKEYFLYSGSIHPAKNSMNLLKAFSNFKKWQKSNMQLVIAGAVAEGYEQFTKDLKTYKYRNEVVLAGSITEEERSRLTAAAYALVQPSFFEPFGAPVLEALQSEVPAIVCNTGAMAELYGAAVLYADPSDLKDIAAQMITLFKDENRRNELIAAGKLRSKEYSWNRTAGLLWQAIEQCRG